jgi:hypothetical protein
MDNGNGTKLKNGTKHIVLLGYFCGAFVSAIGGNYLVMRQMAPEIVAPDRFTGTEAQSLIRDLEHIDQSLRSHLNAHPDMVNQFDRRIIRLEEQYKVILKNQERILKRLDQL